MATGIEFSLKQRGRACVDFLTYLALGGTGVRGRAEALVDMRFSDLDALPEDLDERHELIEGVMVKERAYRAEQLLGEWHSRQHGVVADAAFEEVRDTLEPRLRQLDQGSATLELDANFVAPRYWDGVKFHRTEKMWDDSDYSGCVHGEIIHRKMVDRLYPGGIFKQRRAVAAMAPRDSYTKILEMGCSTGHFTVALAQSYPEAEIHGIDLSHRTLEHTRRVANALGQPWKLYQRPAEDTGFATDSFDLVASYILLHEMPGDIIRRVFAEAFRVLEPGGDMIMSDVTRYADLDKLAEWRADRGARYGGEPHWRSAASLDLAEAARDAGFEQVFAGAEPPMKYPYVVRGSKPQ
ncbi:MAG: SAM-dependent methyltransferase [Halieaceae bacterium]|jgi:SAM-dependent methyltransferase